MGPLSILYKSFLWPLLTYTSPGLFSFLSATNFTKLECLHRAASCTITDCLLSSPIPLLLTEASLPPQRVTLNHFTLSSYEWALHLPTSFPISGLARLGVKPRLYRSSWRALASTHPLMIPSTCSRETLLACPPFPPWNLPLFTVESTLSTPCSRSDPPLSRQGGREPHLGETHTLVIQTLSPIMIWCFGLTALFLFLLAKAAPMFLPTARSVALRPLSFSAGPVCSSFSGEACTILHALCWPRQHQQSAISLLFSCLTLVLSSPPCPLPHLSFHLKLCGRSGRNCLLSPSVLSDYNGSPDTRFS